MKSGQLMRQVVNKIAGIDPRYRSLPTRRSDRHQSMGSHVIAAVFSVLGMLQSGRQEQKDAG